MGTEFAGALCYADDIMLLAPTLAGLRRMLREVELFAERYSVTFNPSKCALLTYGNCSRFGHLKFQLCGSEIPRQTNAKHLGVIAGDGAASLNVQNAIGDVYGRTNCLMAQFKNTPWRIRIHLFTCFCLHMYGSELWDPCAEHTKRFEVALRKCIRHLLSVPSSTHRALLTPITGILPANTIRLNRCHSFIRRCSQSRNNIVKLCMDTALDGSRSSLSKSAAKLCELHGCSRRQLLSASKHIRPTADAEIEAIASAVVELLDVVGGDAVLTSDEQFTDEFARSLLRHLCTA